jgi:rare lipoprotein A
MLSEFVKKIVLVVAVLSLFACESQPQKNQDGLRNIIPTAEKDRGPDQYRDMRHVRDAVPKFENRTIAGNKSPYMVKGVVYRVMNDPVGYQAQGLASWYGEKFHGNKTSNGEIYDMYAMTAAHKTLPIPSYVKVERQDTGRSVIVRVNDRGPFAEGRVIDLSYTAAQKLGFLEQGTAPVQVTYIHVERDSENVLSQPVKAQSEEHNQQRSALPDDKTDLYVQLGAYKHRSSAQSALESAAGFLSWPVNIHEPKLEAPEKLYRVQVGPLPDDITAEILRQALVEKGFGGAIRVVR